MESYYYNGAWRMDWGLGNPNKTAVLIACLMLAVWVLAFIWKRGFWPALVLFTVLAWCLVQTYSRGGMVALVAGVGILLFWTPRPWPRPRWLAVFASLWVLGGFILFAKAQNRYEQGLFTEDQSIGHRIIIWKRVPEMMIDAPWGWGLGKAGDSYTQWFQPVDQTLNYLNLLNSHFTWMVELGWLGSLFYVFAWLAVLILCWPIKKTLFGPLALSIWVAFGLGACFSAVAESPWLWLVPLLFLGVILWERFRLGEWPRLGYFAVAGAGSLFLVGLLLLLGLNKAKETLPITATSEQVTVGRGEVKTLIMVNPKTLGHLYGHTFRKFLADNADAIKTHTFIFTSSPVSTSSDKINQVILTALHAEQKEIDFFAHVPNEERLILVNPFYFPEETKLRASPLSQATVYFGEYTESPSRSSWSNVPGIKAVQIDGASDFIPNWPQALLQPLLK